MSEIDSYRVFISYSHEDRKNVVAIVDALKENGLLPMWDEDIKPGQRFTKQIKMFIAHSHVFMPFITKSSSNRGWVHQEIGYAMALGIPVLPIVYGVLPREMISHLHGLKLASNDLRSKSRLNNIFSLSLIRGVVNEGRRNSRPLYECADFQEERTKMMAEYTRQVSTLGYAGKVRQRGALSSFHIPDKGIRNEVWKKRWGPYPKDTTYCRILREERQELDIHARKCGCDLIIDPFLDFALYGPEARKIRLQTLVETLKTMPDSMVRVAINKGAPKGENIIIVGDWFAAYSISGTLGRGYDQTIFTRHAPSIRKLVEDFDEHFEDLLGELGWNSESSKQESIGAMESIISGIH